MTIIQLEATTKFANTEETKFHPVLKIGGWEYTFHLVYDSEDAAYAKAKFILDAEMLNLKTSLNNRQGIWLATDHRQGSKDEDVKL